MSKKGRRFELELCHRLSIWWTDGKDDGIFYHTHVSGARATARGRKGKQTANSAGDIMALCPSGAPLLDLITWEAKRGYSRDTVHDILDKSAKAAEQQWEKWFAQAEASAAEAGSFGWAVAVRRNQRAAVVFMPVFLTYKLADSDFWTPSPKMPQIVLSWDGKNGRRGVEGMTLDAFLEGDPKVIKELAKRL